MAKIADRLLLFLLSTVIIIVSVCMVLSAFEVISYKNTSEFWYNVHNDAMTSAIFISVCIAVLIISSRMFVLSVRSERSHVPSIDQRTDIGDIRISMEAVENLALKAANRSRGVRDLKARVKISSAGLDITIRSVVDGESSIPNLTEEMQNNIKIHVEEITGIPVSIVSVYVANITQTAQTFKSRVE